MTCRHIVARRLVSLLHRLQSPSAPGKILTFVSFVLTFVHRAINRCCYCCYFAVVTCLSVSCWVMRVTSGRMDMPPAPGLIRIKSPGPPRGGASGLRRVSQRTRLINSHSENGGNAQRHGNGPRAIAISNAPLPFLKGTFAVFCVVPCRPLLMPLWVSQWAV